MANILKNYLYSYFSVFLLSTAIVHGNTTQIRKGITLQLIHRFSPSLSFHNVDTFEKFLERNRKQFIHQHTAAFQQEGVGVSLITPSTEHLFFVNLSIGEPPIPQYLAMGTASRFTWVVGDSGNKKYKYSPDASSTHHYFSCSSSMCKKILQSKCDEDKDKNCMVQIRYVDGQVSDVELGSDQLVFNNAIVKNVVMGINIKPKGDFGQDDFYGVFGLSPKYPSFTNWLTDLGANKFSYYINGVVTKKFHPHARLTLGDLAEIQDHNTTPLRLDGAHYQLSLESLSLGVEKLDIEPKVFAYTGKGESGVTIDTGTVITYLTDPAFNKLFGEVADLMFSRGFPPHKSDPNSICFYGSLEELKRTDFPVLSFNFAEGASLQLNEDDLFMEREKNSVCMTLRRSSSAGSHLRGLTVIGLTAQQDYIMGFDLENSRLSMKLSDL